MKENEEVQKPQTIYKQESNSQNPNHEQLSLS